MSLLRLGRFTAVVFKAYTPPIYPSRWTFDPHKPPGGAIFSRYYITHLHVIAFFFQVDGEDEQGMGWDGTGRVGPERTYMVIW